MDADVTDFEPIRDDELEELFSSLRTSDGAVLAVSGGSDSIAMLLLAARWREIAPDHCPKFEVVTVDHGLRPESGDEAQWVGRVASDFGFRHAILPWHGSKPKSRIQETARRVRYELIASYCHQRGILHGATAHHLDDQAETVIMRLARGSGVDGMAAIPRRAVHSGVIIERPLLDIAKSRLIATLKNAGQTWVDDPSNELDCYERNKVRSAMMELRKLGISSRRLALTAERMRRAQEALDVAANDFLSRSAKFHSLGFCTVDLEQFIEVPYEVSLRALRKALEAIGGSMRPVGLKKLERLTDVMRSRETTGCTLAGCRISYSGSKIQIAREKGRNGFPELTLNPGQYDLWDGRFRVWLSSSAPAALTVRALGHRAYKQLQSEIDTTPKWSANIGAGLVSFWSDSDLIVVPHLGYRAPSVKWSVQFGLSDKEFCTAEFISAADFSRYDVTAGG